MILYSKNYLHRNDARRGMLSFLRGSILSKNTSIDRRAWQEISFPVLHYVGLSLLCSRSKKKRLQFKRFLKYFLIIKQQGSFLYKTPFLYSSMFATFCIYVVFLNGQTPSLSGCSQCLAFKRGEQAWHSLCRHIPRPFLKGLYWILHFDRIVFFVLMRQTWQKTLSSAI